MATPASMWRLAAALPGFVLVSTDEGPTRVLLRGAGVTATVAADGEEIDLDGAASHTWVERSVEGVTALGVALPAEDAAPDGDEPGADLPIVTGLVRVGRVDRPGVQPALPAAPVAVEAPAVVEAPVAVEAEAPEPDPEPEPEPVDEGADEPAPFDEEPVTEVLGQVPDPLSDPIPPLDGPDEPVETDEPDPAAGADLSFPPPPLGATPAGWIPPPPPSAPPLAAPGPRGTNPGHPGRIAGDCPAATWTTLLTGGGGGP